MIGYRVKLCFLQNILNNFKKPLYITLNERMLVSMVEMFLITAPRDQGLERKMSAYKLNEFVADVSEVVSFDVLKSLNVQGFQNIDGDDYVKSGPQYMRYVFKKAVENANHLIKSGLPEAAFMDDVWEYLFLGVEKQPDTPEIWNRKNVIACVNLIKTCAKK